MNKTIFIIVALFGFIIILLCCLLLKTELIENDIFARTNTALTDSGFISTNVSLNGRDVTLSGAVKSQQLKYQAGIIAENIWGVRTVNNSLFVDVMEMEPLKENNVNVLKDLSVANIEFKTGNAIIQPQSFDNLNDLSEILINYPDTKISLRGHADSTGNENFNIVLSKNRAESVKAYLIKKGIDSNRLVVESFGSAKPIAPNGTVDGRKKNRRVEFNLMEVN
ncbi:MAG: OmpA family protein [Bacteroidota bacterium]